MRARVYSLRTLVSILVAAVLMGGCSTVAAVLLDLPEQPEPASQSGPESRGALAGPADAVPEERAPLPIELLTDRDSIIELLPKDVAGGVDWVAAIREGVIEPRWNRPGDTTVRGLPGFAFDISLKGPDQMFDARFPHSAHVEWVGCQSCHEEIFEYGGEPITMEAVNAGEACGRCHGLVAFAVSTCVRCHGGLPAYEPIEEPLGRDLIMARAEAAGAMDDAYPAARFPHWSHRIRYRCTACHPSTFAMRAGTDTLAMAPMREGTACGSCHDGAAAFGLVECRRCHTEPTSDASEEP